MSSALYPVIATSQPALLPVSHPDPTPQPCSIPAAASFVQDAVAKAALDIIKGFNFFDAKGLAERQKRSYLREGGLEVVLNLLSLGATKPKEYHKHLEVAAAIAPEKYRKPLFLEWIKELLKLEGQEDSLKKAYDAFMDGEKCDNRFNGFLMRAYLEYCKGDQVNAFYAFYYAFIESKGDLTKRVGELAESVLRQLDPETNIDKFNGVGKQMMVDFHSRLGLPDTEVHFNWQIKILEKYQNEPSEDERAKWNKWNELFLKIFKAFAVTDKRKQKLGDLYYSAWLFTKSQKNSDISWSNLFKLEVLKKAGIKCDNLKALHELGYDLFYKNDFMGIKDQSQGRTYLKLAADRGFALSQYQLGVISKNDKEVPNTVEVEWFEKAILADPSHSEAHWSLGVRYWKGKGVKKDQLKAMGLIAKAAALGSPEAQEDVAENQKYYDLVKRAEEGDTEAQFDLAILFQTTSTSETIFDRNDEIAIELYKKIGMAPAFNNWAVILEQQGNRKGALELLHKAVELGTDSMPMLSLASYYWDGIGVDRDQIKAVELIAKAAKLGYVKAKEHPSQVKGVWDIVKAAQEGDAKAQYELGKMFDPSENSESIFKKSEELAFNWYEKAVAQDFTGAIAKIVLRYKGSARIPLKDPKRDLSLLQRLAEEGHPQGIWELGCSFWKGIEVERDFAKAIELFRQSAEKGYAITVSYCQQYHDHFEQMLAALKGDAELQYQVSQWFDPDCGKPLVFEANKSVALFWLEMAAENGHMPSISCLSRYYTYGVGVPVDAEKAGKYFNKLVQLQSVPSKSTSKKPAVKKKKAKTKAEAAIVAK